jgi:hypothetical protein
VSLSFSPQIPHGFSWRLSLTFCVTDLRLTLEPRDVFLNALLKLPIKSESFGNERDVDHFIYWRKYDIKNAEYLLDDK